MMLNLLIYDIFTESKLKYYLTLSHFQRSHLPTWAEREDCRVAPKAHVNCEYKHRLSIKRNWNEEEADWWPELPQRRWPPGTWCHLGHNGPIGTKHYRQKGNQSQVKPLSSHWGSSLAWSGATPVRNKIWYPKTQEPVRQQLVRHKIQLHVGQGKGLPRNQTPKHNCYPSTSLTMLLNLNDLWKLWPFNIFEGRIWFKLFLI